MLSTTDTHIFSVSYCSPESFRLLGCVVPLCSGIDPMPISTRISLGREGRSDDVFSQEKASGEASMEPSCAQGTSAMGKLIASNGFTHPADISDMACHRTAGSQGTLLASIDEIGGIMLARVPVRPHDGLSSRLPCQISKVIAHL